MILPASWTVSVASGRFGLSAGFILGLGVLGALLHYQYESLLSRTPKVPYLRRYCDAWIEFCDEALEAEIW